LTKRSRRPLRRRPPVWRARALTGWAWRPARSRPPVRGTLTSKGRAGWPPHRRSARGGTRVLTIRAWRSWRQWTEAGRVHGLRWCRLSPSCPFWSLWSGLSARRPRIRTGWSAQKMIVADAQRASAHTVELPQTTPALRFW